MTLTLTDIRKHSSVIFDQLTDEFITVRLPWWWLFRCGVKLVVEKTECLLAAKSISREQRAVSCREFDFYVHAIRRTPLDERRPEPIVHVVISDVADDVTPPIDALVEVRERLFHPLQVTNESVLNYRTPFSDVNNFYLIA